MVRREKRRQFKEKVLSGYFLPPPTTIDLRPVINHHLTYLTSWIEERSAKTTEIEAIPAARSAEVDAKKVRLTPRASFDRHATTANTAPQAEVADEYKAQKKKLAHSLQVRTNDATQEAVEKIKKSRSAELKRKKGSFPPETPMPGADIR